MKSKFLNIFTNANSLFWKIYELISAIIVALCGMIIVGNILIILISNYYGHIWMEYREQRLIDLIAISAWVIFAVILIDIVKFNLTGSQKDELIRKWFSFRWAQKYKPDEVLIVPDNYTGNREDLLIVICGKCGANHGFVDNDNLEMMRVCDLYGCRELISTTLEYRQVAMGKSIKRKEYTKLVRDIRSTPFRFYYRESWKITEYVFKLCAWMMFACAILAGGIRLENHSIKVLGIILCILWISNLFVSINKAMFHIQDEMISWSNKGNQLLIFKKILAIILSFIFSALAIQLILISLDLFVEIYSNIGALG